MAKRSATQVVEDSPSSKARAVGGGGTPSRLKATVDEEEMGEFEDAFDDEIESDGEVVSGQATPDEDAMDIDDQVLPPIEESDPPPRQRAVYIPGTRPLEQDEILEPDLSVYHMLHHMNVNWPCLSFDILRDNLGDERKRFPATSYVVAGTQADSAKKNQVLVMKMSHMHRCKKDDDGSDSDEDSESDDEDDVDEDAVLEFKTIAHHGGVNRIRAQPCQQTPLLSQPYHVATWAETGKVHIWDVRPLMEALDTPGYEVDKSRTSAPSHSISAHGHAEGFAMDWGGSVSGTSSSLRLLTGDIHSKIYLTTSSPSGFNTSPQPFTSHTSSVEDLQWSPSEMTVFASCSADQSVRIWDIRLKGRKSVVSVPRAHPSDVNVISWNKTSTYLLLSGGDEGGLRVWDLRSLKGADVSSPSPVASFAWHTEPITSVEWHPTDESIFCASGADDQVTLWDLGVELDPDEMAEEVDSSGKEVPPQLLFIHQGQTNVKEIHWHPQIPGTIISTALDGFNVFKTISV